MGSAAWRSGLARLAGSSASWRAKFTPYARRPSKSVASSPDACRMAYTATRPRGVTARRPCSRRVNARTRARTATPRIVRTAKPGKLPGRSGLAGLVGRKVVSLIARRAVRAGARTIRSAGERTADAARAFEARMGRRLPIQVSLDVAVPLSVAWEEWAQLAWLTEGVHRIEQVERDGTFLVGRTTGAHARE